MCAVLELPADDAATVIPAPAGRCAPSSPFLLVPEGAWPPPAFVLTLRIARTVAVDEDLDGQPVVLGAADTTKWVAASAAALAQVVTCSTAGAAGARLLLARPRTVISSMQQATDGSGVVELRVEVRLTSALSLAEPLPPGNTSLIPGEVWCRAPPAVLLSQPDASDADVAAVDAALARQPAGCVRNGPSLPMLSRASVVVWPARWPLPHAWRAAALVEGSGVAVPATANGSAFPSVRSCPAASVLVNPSGPVAVLLHGQSVLLPQLVGNGSNVAAAWAVSSAFASGAATLPVAATPEAAARHAALLAPPLDVACPSTETEGTVLISASASGRGSVRALQRSRPPCPPLTLLMVAAADSDAEAGAAGNASAFIASPPRPDAAPPSVCQAAAVLVPGAAAWTVAVRPRSAAIACPPVCTVADVPRAAVFESAADRLWTTYTGSSVSGPRRNPAAGASGDAASDGTASADAFAALEAVAAAGGLGIGPAALGAASNIASTGLPELIPGAKGFRYARPCTRNAVAAAGLNTTLSEAGLRVCANESHPSRFELSSSLCQWGEAEDCVPCPQGGLCPGGYRLWSARGWWVRSEDSLLMPVRCAFPAETRCVGWDAQAGRTACGLGYAPGVYACARCDNGYYADSASTGGACKRCPFDNSNAIRAAALAAAVVVGGAAAVLALMCAVSIVIAWRIGASTMGAVQRLSAFLSRQQ